MVCQSITFLVVARFLDLSVDINAFFIICHIVLCLNLMKIVILCHAMLPTVSDDVAENRRVSSMALLLQKETHREPTVYMLFFKISLRIFKCGSGLT